MIYLFDNATIDYTKHITRRKYSSGEVIFNEGDECREIGIIVYGEVLISTFTYSEREYTIVSLTEKELFGNSLLFSSSPFFLGDVICQKNTEIIFINKKQLMYLLQNDNIILQNYLKINADKTIHLQRRIKVLSQKSIRDKILFFIKENSLRKENEVIINTKEELARYLNIPRPSLSRELIKMQEEGLIESKGKKIKLKIKV